MLKVCPPKYNIAASLNLSTHKRHIDTHLYDRPYKEVTAKTAVNDADELIDFCDLLASWLT